MGHLEQPMGCLSPQAGRSVRPNRWVAELEAVPLPLPLLSEVAFLADQQAVFLEVLLGRNFSQPSRPWVAEAAFQEAPVHHCYHRQRPRTS